MTIVNRLQMKITEKGYTIKTFEEEMKFGNGTIRRWDKNAPSIDKVAKVANFLEISIDWLIFGKEKENLSTEEKEILEAYRRADEKGKEAILATSKIFSPKSEQETLSTSRTG